MRVTRRQIEIAAAFLVVVILIVVLVLIRDDNKNFSQRDLPSAKTVQTSDVNKSSSAKEIITSVKTDPTTSSTVTAGGQPTSTVKGSSPTTTLKSNDPSPTITTLPGTTTVTTSTTRPNVLPTTTLLPPPTVTTTPPTTTPTTTSPTTTTTRETIPANVAFDGRVIWWHNSQTEVSTEQVQLWWTDVANESGYRIYQDRIGCGGPETHYTELLQTVTVDTTTTVVSNARGYLWRGCLNANVRVVAFNSAGESGPAGPFGGVILNAPTPNAPVMESYRATSPTQVAVTWLHTGVLGFETFQYVIADTKGSPLTGTISYMWENLGGPTKRVVYLVNNGVLPQCVTVYAVNAVHAQFPNWTSTLSQPICLTPER